MVPANNMKLSCSLMHPLAGAMEDAGPQTGQRLRQLGAASEFNCPLRHVVLKGSSLSFSLKRLGNSWGWR